MFGWLKRRRRARLRAQPFPEAWRRRLEADAPYYRVLPPATRAALEPHIQVFLAEKRFEGCNGVTVDERMRVLVAAYASMLIAHRETDCYPGLHAVLVYPAPFRAEYEAEYDDGFVEEVDDLQEGESWDLGTVILSWKDVELDLSRFDGRNLLFHEFAHQLWDNGEAERPGVDDPAAWRTAMAEEFELHCRAVDRNRRTYLDPYGAEDPAEFFSCVTEQFLEQPRLFRRRHERLYTLLRGFYRQDPEAYFSAPRR